MVIVDWSAASRPKTGRDSIWICRRDGAGERLDNPPTRHAARALLAEFLAGASGRGERVLLGFDFPFGYPTGFAAGLALRGPAWRAVWDEIAGLIEDSPDNANNRFAVAAELNRRISQGPFPFWGCPARAAGPFLAPRHHRRHDTDGLAERRLIDRHVPTTQPCWKLLGTGSVGGQALTGIPIARALRDDPRWRPRARVWPFETGLAASPDAQIVMAEVYPSLWRSVPRDGEPKDAAQVRETARFLAARDHAGELSDLFAGDARLTAEERRRVETEEAWTLGVTAPHRRAASATAKTYLRDPAEIYRRSFALIRQEARLDRLPRVLHPLALRVAHAVGETAILDDLAFSRGAVAAGRKALAAGAPILVDATMVAAGIVRARLPADNPVICTLNEPEAAELAARLGTTRSAAAVELWRPHLAGAVVAIGNAPTSLFHLLDLIAAGAPRPALILGFPVGFVGAAEAKAALAGFGRGLSYVTLSGRRGGSALAAAAVNALSGPAP